MAVPPADGADQAGVDAGELVALRQVLGRRHHEIDDLVHHHPDVSRPDGEQQHGTLISRRVPSDEPCAVDQWQQLAPDIHQAQHARGRSGNSRCCRPGGKDLPNRCRVRRTHQIGNAKDEQPASVRVSHRTDRNQGSVASAVGRASRNPPPPHAALRAGRRASRRGTPSDPP